MSKPLPMHQRKEQEVDNKHQAARAARSAAASAQAGEDGRVQAGIQKESKYRRNNLTRCSSLQDEKITVYGESEVSSPASGNCRRQMRQVALPQGHLWSLLLLPF